MKKKNEIKEAVDAAIAEGEEIIEQKETFLQKVKGFFKRNGKKIAVGVGFVVTAVGAYVLGANGGIEFLECMTESEDSNENGSTESE